MPTTERRVLCLAPHADDESLGAGGSLARHAADGDEVHVGVVTGHGDGTHPLWGPEVWDVVRAEAREAARVLGAQLFFEDLPAVLVPDQPVHEVTGVVAGMIERVRPHVLYVPFPFDLHNDHRAVFYAASVAWRTTSPVGRAIQEIYSYEVQSETHWNAHRVEPAFSPDHYVDITDYLATKRQALECYSSQMRPFPDARSVAAVEALARWRGSLVNCGAAEAFMTIRTLR